MPTHVSYDPRLERYIIKYQRRSTDDWIELQYDADIVEWCKLADAIASVVAKSDLLADSYVLHAVKNSTAFNQTGRGLLMQAVYRLTEQGEKLKRKLKPVITVDYEAKTISYTDLYRNSAQRGRYFNEMKEEINHIESECKRIEDMGKSMFNITVSIESTNAIFDDAERVLAKFDAEIHHQVEEEVGMVDALVAENERIVSRLKLVLKSDGTIDEDITNGRSIEEFVSSNTDMAEQINTKIIYLLERIKNWELPHEPLDTNMGI